MPDHEDVIDPEIPVIDSHHHLFDRAPDIVAHVTKRRRFLIDEYVEMVDTGHRVLGSVVVEVHNMYRTDGPEELRVVGETEFFNGQGAMGASGLWSGVQVAAGIIGPAELRHERAADVLDAQIAAAPARFKGVRQTGVWDEDSSIAAAVFPNPPHLYGDPMFRRGFAHLEDRGLTFDAFLMAPQLPDLVDLARTFPGTTIVLNHLGQPVGVGRHAGRLEEERPQWSADMAAVAECPNVVVKMGGLGSLFSGSPSYRVDPSVSSQVLAAEWGPYVETALELFGADRLMFESNLPTDGSGPFLHVCNAYKRLLSGCTEAEKRAVFAGTAARVYDLGHLLVDSPSATLA